MEVEDVNHVTNDIFLLAYWGQQLFECLGGHLSMCCALVSSQPQADDRELRHGHHGVAATALSRIGRGWWSGARGGVGENLSTSTRRPRDEMD